MGARWDEMKARMVADGYQPIMLFYQLKRNTTDPNLTHHAGHHIVSDGGGSGHGSRAGGGGKPPRKKGERRSRSSA